VESSAEKLDQRTWEEEEEEEEEEAEYRGGGCEKHTALGQAL
jgi:hypothetical protein